MDVYQQILDATVAVQESDGQMLGADSGVAYMLTNAQVSNANDWATQTSSTYSPWNGGTSLTGDAVNLNGGTIEGVAMGTPLPNYNYSNWQIQIMITYVADAVNTGAGTGNAWSGDDLTRAQIINQTWTAESQAMGARSQVDQTALKTPSDAYNSQLQLDQQAQQGAVSALGNVLVDLMSGVANTMGQGVV